MGVVFGYADVVLRKSILDTRTVGARVDLDPYSVRVQYPVACGDPVFQILYFEYPARAKRWLTGGSRACPGDSLDSVRIR